MIYIYIFREDLTSYITSRKACKDCFVFTTYICRIILKNCGNILTLYFLPTRGITKGRPKFRVSIEITRLLRVTSRPVFQKMARSLNTVVDQIKADTRLYNDININIYIIFFIAIVHLNNAVTFAAVYNILSVNVLSVHQLAKSNRRSRTRE